MCLSIYTSTLVSLFADFFFFKQKTAYEMRISDWSSDVCSSVLMAGWSLESDWHAVVWTGLLQGVGLGLVFVPLNVMSFATLPSEYRTDGAGLLSLSRNIGASLGISVVSFLLARNIQISHADLAGHITAFNLPTDPNTAQHGR